MNLLVETQSIMENLTPGQVKRFEIEIKNCITYDDIIELFKRYKENLSC